MRSPMKRSSRPRPRAPRPYEKPRILSREKLEVIAVACSPGKASGQGGDCLTFVNS